MVVKRLSDPAAFLAAAGSLLLEDEARHNLVLGIAGTLRDHPSVYPEHRLWLVENDDGLSAPRYRHRPSTSWLPVPRPMGPSARWPKSSMRTVSSCRE